MNNYEEEVFTKDENGINLDINQLQVGCITNSNDAFSIDADGNIIANSITTRNQSSQSNQGKVNLPVGTIYENRYNIKMEDYFEGVWERFANGRVLVGVDESDEDFKVSNKNIGEKRHTLVQSELPKKIGTIYIHDNYINETAKWADAVEYAWSNKVRDSVDNLINDIGGSSHNNIQPSTTIYRWIRVR